MQEIKDLPASEYAGWQEYFQIFPFNVEQREMHLARLLATIVNMSGKAAQRHVSASDLVYDYLNPPALEEEPDGWETFKNKLKSIQAGTDAT